MAKKFFTGFNIKVQLCQEKMYIMKITNNFQFGSPNFKQISITENGQRALKSNPYYYHLIEDAIKVNNKHPNTKYWNMVIDGEKEYYKYRDEFRYNPVFKYISKITGEVFENLHINPPTDTWPGNFHMCASKNHKCLPPEVLLLSSNHLITDESKVKELAFDIKDNDKANRIWEQYIKSNSKDIYIYEKLEEMSDKYESSLKIGIDTLLNNNPEYKNEMQQILKRDNYVWFSDGGVDQWT